MKKATTTESFIWDASENLLSDAYGTPHTDQVLEMTEENLLTLLPGGVSGIVFSEPHGSYRGIFNDFIGP